MNLEQIDKDFCLHTYKRNYVNFTHGESATLFSKDGKDYVDFTSGIGVASLGHGNKDLAKVIFEQAKKLIHISNLYLIEPQALLAKKLVELSGFDMRVFFNNSGAEASELGLNIARKYGEKEGKGRYKIVTLDNSFHGRSISEIKESGKMQSKNTDGFLHAKDLNDIKNVVDNQTIGVMIELIQGEGGLATFSKESVQDLAKFLKEKDILFIVDEVQTGIYRSGEFLASNYYGIAPDIISVAKAIASGLPMGVTMTNLKDIYSFGEHGSTFGGNFLCSKTALFVLDFLEKEKLSGRLENRVKIFDKKIENSLKDFPMIFTEAEGIGLIRGLRVKKEAILNKIIEKSFESGVLVLKSAKDIVRFLPPLIISEEEIKKGFERFYEAIETI